MSKNKEPVMAVYQSTCVWKDAEHPEGYSPVALCESYGDERDPRFAVVERATKQIIGLYSNIDDAVKGWDKIEKNNGGTSIYQEKYVLTKVRELT